MTKYNNNITLWHFWLLLLVLSVLVISIKWRYIGDHVGESEAFQQQELLRNGNISAIRRFGGSQAFSKKVIIEIEDCDVTGIVKMIHPDPTDTIEETNNDLWIQKEVEYDVGIAGIQYQGFAEIAAFHVDQVLQLYKKPATVGRLISKKELDRFDITAARYFFGMQEPNSSVLVSVQLWLKSIHSLTPSVHHFRILTGEEEISKQTKQEDLRLLKEISDISVFDYLIDDHDRNNKKNWVSDGAGKLVSIDSGLAWRHGPFAHSDCFNEIMCDPTETWRLQDKGEEIEGRVGPMKSFLQEGSRFALHIQQECPKICRFNSRTIQRLRDIGPDAAEESQKFGSLVKQSLMQDDFYPLFHLGRWQKKEENESRFVRFEVDSFYKGLDLRLQTLLQHVEVCLSLYENVLL